MVLAAPLFGGWAEERLAQMTVDEKIGQLFAVPISPPRGEAHFQDLTSLFRTCHIGNMLLKQAHPLEQVSFLNSLQKASDLPLLAFADAEWGLGMRMKETLSYPRNLTLGAVQDHSLLQKLGNQIAEQCRLVGIHANLAPVADVNTNPKNPVIHTRSFGDDPELVARRVTAFFQGMQEKGVLGCAKHFPGHGDTIIDSHRDLPIVQHDLHRLKNVEWVPFKEAVDRGIKGVMSAHLLLPALDQAPCTFSNRMITGLLKEELGFQGLVITDALNMKALANYYSHEEIALQAFLAGHHILLYGSHIDEEVDKIIHESVPRAFAAIKKAYQEGGISEKTLNDRVLKILQIKEELGLHQERLTAEVPNLMKELHHPDYYQLKAMLFEEAATLYRDEGIPNLEQKIAYIQIGKEGLSPFFNFLEEGFSIIPTPPEELDPFDAVIIGYYGGDFNGNLLTALRGKDVYIAHFTTPYDLSKLPEKGTVLVGYEGALESERVVSEILQGKKIAKGKLPVALP